MSAALALVAAGPAAAQFRELAGRVPNSANALVLLNVEKIFQSPRAVAEGWKEKMDKAFESGLSRIPPKAVRYVIASQIDFESMQPRWEAAVADFAAPPSMEVIANARQGTPDKIGNVPAVALPTDALVLQLGEKTLGAIAPANRQEATRWIRQLSNPQSPTLSPYLQKGAAYSDAAGTEIIMVLDLDGVFPPDRVLKYLKAKKALDASAGDRDELAKLIADMQGLRVGIRIGEKFSGKVTLDFDGETAKAEPASPGDLAANQGKSTLRYFQSVTKFLDDLKNDMRDLKTMGQAAVWCDKYARKIEKLPMLGVDPDMLDYGKFVATALRGGALDTRQTNIQAGAMQYQVGAGSQSGIGTGYYDPAYYGGYGYGRGVYGGGWYGGGPVANRAAVQTAARQELRAESQQRRILRNQAQANIAGDLNSIKAQIAEVTNDVRRTMTERYKLEF